MAKKSVDPSRKRTARSGNGREFDGSRADENSLRPELARTEKSRQDATRRSPPRMKIPFGRAVRDSQLERSIERTRHGGSGTAGRRDPDSRAVPDYINARYIKVGNKYHFPNGDLAFKDRGRALSTGLENTEVIRDLIAIAKERGWNEIALGGTERFRKEAWQQANLEGLSVRGYRPSELERAQLVRRMGRERQGGRCVLGALYGALGPTGNPAHGVRRNGPRRNTRQAPSAGSRTRRPALGAWRRELPARSSRRALLLRQDRYPGRRTDALG